MPPESDPSCGSLSSARAGTLSIALCTFNGVRYLPRQLESYLLQDRLPDELVVGDDGSSDETPALIAEFSRRAPFPVRFHRNPRNLGVGRNFMQTIQRCTGEFIALSDQDDEWRTDKLCQLARLLQEHPTAGYACSDAALIDEQGASLNQRLWQQYRCPPGNFLRQDASSARHLLTRSDRILGATMLLRSSCLQLMSPIPATWVHDHWLSVMCELLGFHGIASSECLTRYRLHQTQTVGLRRSIGSYRPRQQSFSSRCEQRVRRKERLVDLRLHLENRVIPYRPELACWRPLIDEAEALALQAMARDGLSWWRRKLGRLQDWWSRNRVSLALRSQHGTDHA